MGLALSSSHHYSSQLRVRAQSDRHSSGNTVQLTLVNNKKKTTTPKPNQTKAKEILMTNLKAIITLGILLRVDTFFPVIREMWRCISKRCFSFTRALNTSFLCGQCTLSHRSAHTHTELFYYLLTNTTERLQDPVISLSSSKPFNIKAVFTSVWWHHAEC